MVGCRGNAQINRLPNRESFERVHLSIFYRQVYNSWSYTRLLNTVAEFHSPSTVAQPSVSWNFLQAPSLHSKYSCRHFYTSYIFLSPIDVNWTRRGKESERSSRSGCGEEESLDGVFHVTTSGQKMTRMSANIVSHQVTVSRAVGWSVRRSDGRSGGRLIDPSVGQAVGQSVVKSVVGRSAVGGRWSVGRSGGQV